MSERSRSRIAIWKCWFLRRGGNRSSQRTTSQSKGKDQHVTQPTYDLLNIFLTWISRGFFRRIRHSLFTCYWDDCHSGTSLFQLHVFLCIFYMMLKRHFVPVQVIPVFSQNKVVVLGENFCLVWCKLKTNFLPIANRVVWRMRIRSFVKTALAPERISGRAVIMWMQH